MEKFRCYGFRDDKESSLEKENRKLAKEVALEGIVLLRNEDNVLPLTNLNVALYGNGARMTIKGGSGSGDLRERHSSTIYEGLKRAGFKITTNKWLDRFDKEFKEKKDAFNKEIEEGVKKFNIFQTMKMFIFIGEHHLTYPVASKINEDELDLSRDTCIYVLSRQAGEGKDRELIKGDYYLSDIERENIEKCAKTYKNLVLIINSGSVIDLSFISEINNIKGIIYLSLAGEESGDALASILKGEVTPSAKLADTWAKKYEDYPSYSTFSSLRKDKYNDYYKEGIFVGYKHFNKKNLAPLFPFGYGLSYTEFEIINKDYSLSEESKINYSFEVKNIGNKYKGKEVIQSYLRKPKENKDNLALEDLVLVDFIKTKELDINEKEVVTSSFDLKDFATFNENKGEYILYKGRYTLYFGKDNLNIKPFLNIDLSDDFVVKKAKYELVKESKFKDDIYENNNLLDDKTLDSLPSITIYNIGLRTSNDLNLDFSKYNKLIDKLSNKDLTRLVVGGGYGGKYFNRAMGAAGRTTSNLLKKGIPNICLSDGPAGISIVNKIAYTKNGGTRYIDELPKDWQWGRVKKYGKIFLVDPNKKNITPVYAFPTAFPCETLIAQTFNKELAYKVGNAIGQEMKQYGISYWLAPGLNIHRNPLCGRNFEYYSEDVTLSSLICSNVVKGVQDNGGVGATIKHFACNNEENYRTEVSENVNERALRELYLKVFERVINLSNPKALMTSYNKVNGTYVVNSKDLLINYLRNEVNFNGLIMSDWNSTDQCSHVEALIAGNNLIMPGNKHVRKDILKALKEGKIKREDLIYDANFILDAIFTSDVNKDFKLGGK